MYLNIGFGLFVFLFVSLRTCPVYMNLFLFDPQKKINININLSLKNERFGFWAIFFNKV